MLKRAILAAVLAVLCFSSAPAAPASVIRKVAVVTESGLDAPGRYGVRQLEAALRAKGVAVTEGEGAVKGADFVLVMGARVVAGVTPPQGVEALNVRTGTTYKGKPAIILAGSDDIGLMYATLDLADRVSWTRNGGNPFQFARNISEKPDLKERGIVMFTMNRAYFESRLYDERFWTRYFDMMAKDRFNRLKLTFGYEDGGYMAPLYPYFFDVPGFADVHVIGLTPQQQARNLQAFRRMLQLAAERGIQVVPGIWEHIYRGGGQAGANPWASDGTKPTEGLVWGLNSQNLVPYTVAALKKFYDTFPEITETQLRMHEESGLLTSEIEPFWHDVFQFFRTSEPNIRLEFRAKGLPKSVIKDAQSMGLNIQLDTKIWMEQMGLPYHPTHINKEDQPNARHSYADLLEYPQTYHMNWTLWNGGTQRILLWSDPDYARRLVADAHLYDGQALFVTEFEATKMLGLPHDGPVRDFVSANHRYFDYEFERYWAFYRVFGRLAYNPRASADTWQRDYAGRFGAAAPHVEKAVELASRVMPRVVAASVPYSMFPTTAGWPEMMHLGSLPRYAESEEGSDIAQFMNLQDAAASMLKGTDTAMRRPEETSRWFADTSDAILKEVAAAEKALGGSPASNEFQSTMTDARMLAAMARYHSWRQLGGVNYNLYRQSGNLGAFDAAIADERDAVQAWRDLVAAAGDFYSEDIWFGPTGRQFPHHWKDELNQLETEFTALQAERQAAVAKPGVQTVKVLTRGGKVEVPLVTFVQPLPPQAVAGRAYPVRVKIDSPAGVKWARLRYRHLKQTEDYQIAEMTRDAKSGLYAASIPASFIDPGWGLMFYVEAMDGKGNGRIYPDLEKRTPYFVVGVKR